MTDLLQVHLMSFGFPVLGNFWRERGELKFGSMYCNEVDDGIRQGFDRKLVHKNPQSPLRGEPLCEHIDEARKRDPYGPRSANFFMLYEDSRRWFRPFFAAFT